MHALGYIGDAKAVEPSIQLLKNKEWWVRVDAAEALGNTGDARAVKPLTEALKDKYIDPETHRLHDWKEQERLRIDFEKAAEEALEKIKAKKS